jgi:hypothetical protein
MVAGWHADRENNSMAKRIKLLELRDRRIFSPERGLSGKALAYSNQLMLVRHLMEKGWIGADTQSFARAVSTSFVGIFIFRAELRHLTRARAIAPSFRVEWNIRQTLSKDQRLWMSLRLFAKTTKNS